MLLSTSYFEDNLITHFAASLSAVSILKFLKKFAYPRKVLISFWLNNIVIAENRER